MKENMKERKRRGVARGWSCWCCSSGTKGGDGTPAWSCCCTGSSRERATAWQLRSLVVAGWLDGFLNREVARDWFGAENEGMWWIGSDPDGERGGGEGDWWIGQDMLGFDWLFIALDLG